MAEILNGEVARQLPLEGFEKRPIPGKLRLLAMGKMFWFAMRNRGVGSVTTIDVAKNEVRITSDRLEVSFKGNERIHKPI